MKVLKASIIIIILTAIAIIGGFFYYIHEFAKGFGGNIGTITCIDDNQIKDKYLEKYIDSFYVYYPEYIVPDSIKQDNLYQSLDYDHLSLSKFYFSNHPIEIYYIQWTGPGCVNIRFTYNPITSESSGVFRGDPEDKIKEHEIERIKNRFEEEIISKIEKVILKYESRDSIYIK
ncbi:MAG: hypothetical protein J7604_21465 [Sporocytophaga sp.]|uniref:hypothetical protein n=1 Tax=Sporocytophaga sp. TaxID=2231183 RepID=UPI001B1FFEF6|nr:hypothetical protein [Sporocytophaga sp.]MBO9702796.1 hypothetical protein [Sporocytophaga sp.]